MKFVSIYVIIFYEVGLVLLKFSTKNLQYSTTRKWKRTLNETN